jgi:hypothetical protein
MAKVSLRRVLSKLTVLALATAPMAVAAQGDPTEEPVPCDPELVADVPIDLGKLDARDASTILSRTLAQALSEVRPLVATHLAASWALSDHPVRRAAVAQALEWSFPLVGDGLVLDHLSRDPDPEIRAACAHAAWIRRRTGGDMGVLARLADDPDPEVRAIVARAR